MPKIMDEKSSIQEPIFPYRWFLNGGHGFPSKNISYHGAKVFSCFSGGGGSSMGYKLAGYQVIGCNEIDIRQMECYQVNLGKTPFQYTEDIRLLHQKKLPLELYDLDILDGSPPCSTFSMSGDRENAWGQKKKFREGQAEQCLDDLVFEFLKLADKIKPKIVLIENVKGLLMGRAISYATRIKSMLKQIGYVSMHIVLNSANMGLPQARERVFFIAIRKDLISNISCNGFLEIIPQIQLDFRCKHIPFSIIDEGDVKENLLNEGKYTSIWHKLKPGNNLASLNNGSGFNQIKINGDRPLPTLTGCRLYHHQYPRKMTSNEILLASSFPMDYQFQGKAILYIAGMSVPPIMIANIAYQIKLQWLDKINKKRGKK